VKDDIQAVHHITTTTDGMKATLMATKAMTVGVKATTAMKATTAGMKATLVVTMAMTGKAMAAVVKGTTVGTKAIAIGGMGLQVSGTTAKDHRQVGGLTTSLPMGGKSATACNLVKSGTAASNRSRLTTSWHYERSKPQIQK